MTTVFAILPGVPMAWARPGQRGKARYTTTKQRWHAEALQRALQAAKMRHVPPNRDVRVTCVFVFPLHKSWSKAKREAAAAGTVLHRTRPDIDNLVKIVLDSIAPWLPSFDDCCVSSITAVKRYGVGPRTEIVIDF